MAEPKLSTGKTAMRSSCTGAESAAARTVGSDPRIERTLWMSLDANASVMLVRTAESSAAACFNSAVALSSLPFALPIFWSSELADPAMRLPVESKSAAVSDTAVLVSEREFESSSSWGCTLDSNSVFTFESPAQACSACCFMLSRSAWASALPVSIFVAASSSEADSCCRTAMDAFSLSMSASGVERCPSGRKSRRAVTFDTSEFRSSICAFTVAASPRNALAVSAASDPAAANALSMAAGTS